MKTMEQMRGVDARARIAYIARARDRFRRAFRNPPGESISEGAEDYIARGEGRIFPLSQ